MERMPGDSARSKEKNSSAIWWPPDFVENFQSVSLDPEQSACIIKNAERISHMASQMLWSTGTFSGSIPDGFFSVIPVSIDFFRVSSEEDKNLKEIFSAIPSPDDLHSLGMDGFKADIILVDTEKDKKLSMLKQLSAAMVKGLHSNPALLIKKIAGLVYDFYKRPNSGKSAGNDTSPGMDNKGIQLLGQIRHGSCRPRAILFKVLADFVGLQSKLVVGLPSDGGAACADSYKHMSVMVVLKSVELLVDLMRFPGQLIPFSTKAIILSHISAAGESDSAENDSCDSPLEPNSPLYDFPDKVEVEGPEHPLSRARVWSMLSGDRQSRRKLADGVDSSRLDGTRASNVRRIRRRSISITPEIGDDIVRAVRAMNETLKQNRLLQDRGDDVQCSFSTNVKTQLNPPTIEEISFGHSGTYSLRNQTGASQKAVSLPSSPPEYIGKISERIVDSPRMEAMLSTWNNVLQSSSFLNKPLLPFEEWSINFSELTVGTRVGIGLFGEVFRGIWNGTDVAIKVFLEQDLTRENMEDFCNEIYILSRLRHPNVILFLGACVKPPHLSLVTEYMEMGSLYYLMHTSGQKKKLSWRKRLRMLRDICRGLMCIHRLKIVHRDLKSANCLVDKHGSVKICDFGLSRVSDGPLRDNSSAGTPEWMAPELIRNEPFTEKCDIFSLGVIMWELRTLCRPWEGIPAVQVIYAVAHQGTRLEIPEGPLGKLISDCWAEPQDRPSCQEILTRLLDCEYAFS